MQTYFNISIQDWVSGNTVDTSADYNTSIRYKVYGISPKIASPFLISDHISIKTNLS